MNPVNDYERRQALRVAAESRLEASGTRREKLEEELAAERETTAKEIRACAELGVAKTRIATLARVERSRVYQVLGGRS